MFIGHITQLVSDNLSNKRYNELTDIEAFCTNFSKRKINTRTPSTK